MLTKFEDITLEEGRKIVKEIMVLLPPNLNIENVVVFDLIRQEMRSKRPNIRKYDKPNRGITMKILFL